MKEGDGVRQAYMLFIVHSYAGVWPSQQQSSLAE